MFNSGSSCHQFLWALPVFTELVRQGCGLKAGEKGMTEDEMDGWHHRLDGQEFEQALGVGDGQGGLV